MPFCPRCRFEYTPSAATCPDCGVELVDALPEAPKAVESDFAQVELCVVRGEIHAKLLQGILAREGIPSRAESRWPFAGPYSVLSPSSPIGGGFDAPVRIMVNRGDLGRARIVREDMERGGAHPSDEGPLTPQSRAYVGSAADGEAMTHRDRVLCTIGHQEPDRVPIDLGGTESSGLTAPAYNALKRYLGMAEGCRVFDPYQHVVLVEEEIKDRFGIAAYPVIFEPRRWRAARLPDGSPCEVPEDWQTVRRLDGTEEALGPSGGVIARRASAGFHFDPVNPPLAAVDSIFDIGLNRDIIRAFDHPFFTDESVEQLAARARAMREQSDRVAIFNFQAHILAAGQLLRGFENFMSDLMLEPALADALLSELVEGYCERVDRLFPALDGLVDVILVNDDLGTQAGPMLSTDVYRKRIKPYQQRLFSHLKSASGLPLLFHSCGSVRWAIPDLIEVGVDALNPVQVSAAEMDSATLKRDFGRDITFWGGGCDTQHVLNRGTPAEVREEVKRRMGDFAPGGGFVFTQVHNVQPEVPPENMVAMLEAAAEFGGY